MKQLIRLSLLFTAILLLFTSCGEKEKADQMKTVRMGEKVDCVSETITLTDTNELTDIVLTDEGFAVVAQQSGRSICLTLDEGFQEVSREEYDEYVGAAAWDGEKLWTLRESGIYAGGQQMASLRTRLDRPAMTATAEGVYTYDSETLYWQGEEVALPDPPMGYTRGVAGVWEEDGISYLLLLMRPEQSGMDVKNVLCKLEKGRAKEAGTSTHGGILFGNNAAGFCYIDGGSMTSAVDGVERDYGGISDLNYQISDIRHMMPMKDGGMILVTKEALVLVKEDDGSSAPALDTSETAADEEGEKKVIILCYGKFVDDELQSALDKFQRENKDYQIGIVYCENEVDVNLALLSTDFDMVTSSYGVDIPERLARKGYLTDIREYIGEAGKGIYENLYEAGKVDGVPMFLPFNFRLVGMVLPETVMGDRVNFSDVAEFEETLLSLSDQRFWNTVMKSDVLQHFSIDGYLSWVDREKQTCHFDDESFITLLHIMNRFALDWDTVEANSKSEKPLLKTYYSPSWVYEFDQLYGMYEKKGTGVAYSEYGLKGKWIPYPSMTCSGGLTIDSNSLLAVMKDAPNKEAAKKLMGYLFSVDVQKRATDSHEGSGFSPIVSVGEANIASEFSAEGRDDSFDYLAAQEELKQYIRNADHYASSKSPVIEVVMDEATRYLKGEITAEKAVEYIQNRVQIYLDEQG